MWPNPSDEKCRYAPELTRPPGRQWPEPESRCLCLITGPCLPISQSEARIVTCVANQRPVLAWICRPWPGTDCVWVLRSPGSQPSHCLCCPESLSSQWEASIGGGLTNERPAFPHPWHGALDSSAAERRVRPGPSLGRFYCSVTITLVARHHWALLPFCSPRLAASPSRARGKACLLCPEICKNDRIPPTRDLANLYS